MLQERDELSPVIRDPPYSHIANEEGVCGNTPTLVRHNGVTSRLYLQHVLDYVEMGYTPHEYAEAYIKERRPFTDVEERVQHLATAVRQALRFYYECRDEVEAHLEARELDGE